MNHWVALACGACASASHHKWSPRRAWGFLPRIPCRTLGKNTKARLEAESGGLFFFKSTFCFEKWKSNYGVVVCCFFFFLFQAIYCYLSICVWLSIESEHDLAECCTDFFIWSFFILSLDSLRNNPSCSKINTLNSLSEYFLEVHTSLHWLLSPHWQTLSWRCPLTYQGCDVRWEEPCLQRQTLWAFLQPSHHWKWLLWGCQWGCHADQNSRYFKRTHLSSNSRDFGPY